MCTKAATGGAGSCGTGVVPSRMLFCTPAAGGAVGAFQCVVPKLMAVVALSSGDKAQVALKAVGGGKGGEAWKDCKILCLRAGDGYDDSGRFFTDAAFVRFEPSGLLCKCKPSVEGGEFFANVGKCVGGGDAVHKELCRGGVQLDGGGSRDKVEELRNFGVKRGRFHCIHGSDKEVVCRVAFNALYECRL